MNGINVLRTPIGCSNNVGFIALVKLICVSQFILSFASKMSRVLSFDASRFQNQDQHKILKLDCMMYVINVGTYYT